MEANRIVVEVIGDSDIRPKGSARKEIILTDNVIHILAHYTVRDSTESIEFPAVYPEVYSCCVAKGDVSCVNIEFNPDESLWELSVITGLVSYDFKYLNGNKTSMLDAFSKIYTWVWGTFPPKEVLYNIEAPME